jgi:hypothetical protein
MQNYEQTEFGYVEKVMYQYLESYKSQTLLQRSRNMNWDGYNTHEMLPKPMNDPLKKLSKLKSGHVSTC